jgi:cytochrome c oxidase subunit III
MTFALAGIAMLFIGLTSSYVVRHGLDPGWVAIQMPPVLWINTAVLLASSFTIEKARRALKTPRGAGRSAHLGWLRVTLLLGVVFLGGQFLAWRHLLSYGINLKTSGHSSFFYLLTGLHGLHLLGGILGLSYIIGKAQRARGFAMAEALHPVAAPAPSPWAFEVVALYWHSMDVLWVYLLLLLFGEVA